MNALALLVTSLLLQNHSLLPNCLLLQDSISASDEVLLSNREMTSPALKGSGEPRLVKGADGKLYLSWIEGNDHHARLLFTTLDEKFERWNRPTTIATGENWFINWADKPSLAVLADGTLAAHWLKRTGKKTYAYDIRFTISTDGGARWTKPKRLHDDAGLGEHGFVSWEALGDRFGVLWLNGATIGSGHGLTELRYREVTRDAELMPVEKLDTRTCSCCSTDLTLTDQGELWAIYRDRSAEETRDMSFVRRTADGWTQPELVFEDGWDIPGCPVNGPVLATHGADMAAAWFTGAGDDGGQVKLAFKKGDHFGFPRRIDDGTPEGRPDVTFLENGDAVVIWLEVDGMKAEWRLRLVPKGASSSDSLPNSTPIAVVPLSRATGFAHIVAYRDYLVFAWTQPGPGHRVRTSLLRLRD